MAGPQPNPQPDQPDQQHQARIDGIDFKPALRLAYKHQLVTKPLARLNTIFAVLWRLPKFLVSILEFTRGKNFGSLKSANIVVKMKPAKHTPN
jgi:hypothetical protein